MDRGDPRDAGEATPAGSPSVRKAYATDIQAAAFMRGGFCALQKTKAAGLCRSLSPAPAYVPCASLRKSRGVMPVCFLNR